MSENQTQTTEGKLIALENGKYFLVQSVQIAGRYVDAEGNPTDSGNTLITLQADADMALPQGKILAELSAEWTSP